MVSPKKVFYLIVDLVVSFLMYFVWCGLSFLCVSLACGVLCMFLYPDMTTMPASFQDKFFIIAGLMAFPLSFNTFVKRVKKHGISFSFFRRNDHKNISKTPATPYPLASQSFSPSASQNVIEPVIPITTSPVSVEDSIYLKYGGVDSELLNVDLMDGHEFEEWCASLLLKIGFQKAEVTPASNDNGVDIIAVKDDVRYAIQCKRYSSDLGNTPVQEVHAGKSIYSCHIGAVMTNRYFTPGGKLTAESTGTLLWDRDWIRSKLSIVNNKED